MKDSNVTFKMGQIILALPSPGVNRQIAVTQLS